MTKDQRITLIEYLRYARSSMTKRVWIPGDSVIRHKGGFSLRYHELSDGAIPGWWIDQEIDRFSQGV